MTAGTGWMARAAGAVAALLVALAPPAVAAEDVAPAPLATLVERVDIPFEQFTLNNGLRVVVHTDRKAPLVHVGVWYHVGSKDEPLGKSGFAHLFEHIMFRGSEHSRQDHFQPLEDVGATDFNGTTNFERTNYFQTVPTPALELALFLESDRMGWLLPALTQEILDQERGIVLNEKLQAENAPGGLVGTALLRALFPPDHPYSVSAIGLVPDLKAATLEDARAWFRSHYGPNNAVLVLAGDIDLATARPLVERYFGQIPPGPQPARHAIPVPERTETTHETLFDKVAQPRLSRAWAVPGRGTPGLADLSVGMATLASGPTSFLFDRLVRQERLAVGVSGGLSSFEGAGIASVGVEVRPGVAPETVERRLDQLLAEFLSQGPDADEVERVKMRTVSATIRGLEKVGGFGGKGVALAEGMLYANDPGLIRRELAEIAAVSPESAVAAMRRWLAVGDHRITLLPGERQPAAIDVPQAERMIAEAARPAPARFRPQGRPVDRAAGLPPAGPATRFAMPPIERARLSNGMGVWLVRNDSVPVVRVQLSFPLGVPGDDAARPGTQRMMLALLREGTAGRLGALDGPEIARRLERLGAIVSAGTGLDRTRIGLNALTDTLDESLALFADIARSPTFPETELERVRGQVLASLASEAVNPNGIATRAAPELLFGRAHPYGRSFSGAGTPEGVAAVSRADLEAFHATRLDPAAATLFVVGDADLATLLPRLEAAFGDWRAAATAPDAPTEEAGVMPQAPGRIILYDRPGAQQSVIVAGAALPLTGRDETLPLSLANTVFGGTATARLNRLLREEKSWPYGAFSSVTAAAREMPFLITAPVETPRTADAIAAIRALLADYHETRPAEDGELARARAALIRSLPGNFETGAAMLLALERLETLGRPDDHFETLPARTEAVSLDSVRAAPFPRPDDLVTIVVGDRAAVEPQLRSLGLPLEVRESGAPPAPLAMPPAQAVPPPAAAP
jgi:zinc protease